MKNSQDHSINWAWNPNSKLYQSFFKIIIYYWAVAVGDEIYAIGNIDCSRKRSRAVMEIFLQQKPPFIIRFQRKQVTFLSSRWRLGILSFSFYKRIPIVSW